MKQYLYNVILGHYGQDRETFLIVDAIRTGNRELEIERETLGVLCGCKRFHLDHILTKIQEISQGNKWSDHYDLKPLYKN